LAPIPTTGLGPDDVTALAESTHDQMLATLKDISRDGQSETARAAQSSSPTSSSKDESALQKAGEEKPISQEHADDDSRDADSSDGLGTKDSSDGTEDEMDEDAVLLKRPTDEQTA
jgi:lysophosphatidate acyltransferase